VSTACVCAFAKTHTQAPIEGEVKTRLFPVLTPQQACRVHMDLLQHCLAEVQHSEWQSQLWTTDVQHPYINQCAERYSMSLHFQQGDDLGERMQHAVKESLKKFSYVIIMGSDCPSIDKQLIVDAVSVLKSGKELVLAPAEDGGYVLIGFSKNISSVFENISWGTEQVLLQTIECLQQEDISWHELAVQRDIDRPDDLEFLKQHYPMLLAQ